MNNLSRSWVPGVLGFCLACLAWFGSVMHAAELQELRGDWDRWIEMRKSIQEARASWSVEKAALDQMAHLLEQQKVLLKQRLDSIQSERSAGEKERAELSTRRATLVAAEQSLEALIRRAETRCQAMVVRFPPPLARQVRDTLSKMPAEGEKSGLGLGRRMQNVLGFLNEADKFNGVLTLQKEIRSLEDGEVQCDTLYIGLGQAFYVDPKGVRAGVGRPSPEGWIWEPQSALGPAIRRMVEVYQGDRPAELIPTELEVR